MAVSEGHTVSIPCNFTTISSTPYLFWYRQFPNQQLQHVLTVYKSAEVKNRFSGGKFSSVLFPENKTVPLTIEEVSVQESAVYYCALSPTALRFASCPYKL